MFLGVNHITVSFDLSIWNDAWLSAFMPWAIGDLLLPSNVDCLYLQKNLCVFLPKIRDVFTATQV